MSDRLPVSLTPISQSQKREAEQVANRTRLDLARLQAQQAGQERRHLAHQDLLSGLGELGLTIQGIVDRSAERHSLSARQKAEAELSYGAMDWIRQAPESGVAPSELMDEFAVWYDRQREELAENIGYQPQHDYFMAGTEQNKMRLATQVADIGSRLTMEQGVATHYDSLSQYVAQGDIEGTAALWDDSVEAGFFQAEALAPGGARDESIRQAAGRQIETEGQQIFADQGWGAFNEWITDPDNHPEAWRDSAGYLGGRDRTLGTVRNNVADQAAVQQEQMQAARGIEMAQFIEWSIPFTSGIEGISLENLRGRIHSDLSLYSPLEKATLLRDIYGKTRQGRRDRGTEDTAVRHRDTIVSLTNSSKALTPSNVGHFLQLVNRHYLNGDFGTGREATAEYRRWLSLVEQDAADVDRLVVPGQQMIDSLMHVMRMSNIAGERQLKEGYFIDEKGLFEKGKTKALDLAPMEGDLLDVWDAQGRRSVLSFTEIGDELYGELRAMVKNAPGEVDVMGMARQLSYQRLAGMLPGRQEMEWVGDEGAPLPSDWVVAQEPVGKRRRERLPDEEAIQAGLSFVGEHGLSREQVTVGTRALGEGRTGAYALSYINDPERDWATPLFQARSTMWRELMDEGEYVQAAELAADELPRDAGRLDELRRAGAVYDFTDHGDGSFAVQFVRGGVVYPVYPMEPGDDEAITAMWYPDSGNLLRDPTTSALSPGGAPDRQPTAPAAGQAGLAAAPAAAAEVSDEMADTDAGLTELLAEWDALTEQYLDVNRKLGASPNRGGLFQVRDERARQQLTAQQGTIAAERRDVGAQISFLRSKAEEISTARQHKADVVSNEIQHEARTGELNNTVLEEILRMVNETGYSLTNIVTDLQAIAGMRDGE